MTFKKYFTEFPRNLKIAVPIMLGQVAHLLVAFADNVMVGKLGDEQLAAVSLGNTLIFIALSIGIGFSFSITPLVAEADAKGDTNKVVSVFHSGFFMCFVMGLLLMAITYFISPILYFLDQPKEVVDLAIPYTYWVAFSLLPLMMFQSLKQFIDGLSKTTYSMMASLIANVINVVVNYLLIYGKFGFPRLEVEGAAIGTFVSRVIMFLILFLLLYYKKQFKIYFVKLENYTTGVIRKIFQLGLPTSLQMFFEVSLFTVAIFLSGTLGVKSQAANQIVLNLSALTFMVGVGLGVTATIRVGNQKGVGNIPYLRTVANSLFLMTLFFELLFAFIFLIFHDFLPSLYINDSDVIQLASSILIIAALFQISDGFQVVLLGVLRGLQDVWIPTIICLISYWLVGFPTMYILINYFELGVNGIWIGLLIALSVSAILMLYRYLVLSSLVNDV